LAFHNLPIVKAIFGSLLCLVLAASQSFALKGGPPYPGGTVSLTGTYAGVLQPSFDPTDPFSSNSIGVFTTGVPSSGLATGSFVFFTRGRIFLGTIQGAADPKAASIKGILEASAPARSSADPLTVPSARGTLDAQVLTTQNNSTGLAAVRLNGEAVLFVSEGQTDSSGALIVSSIITAVVDGFKQSNTPPSG
jgi:hypothetical protein